MGCDCGARPFQDSLCSPIVTLETDNDRSFDTPRAVDEYNRYRFGAVTSMERRMIEQHVHPGVRVLDLGCGTGRVTPAIAAAGGEVTGVDLAPAMIEEARKNHPELQFLVADVADMPFPKGAFDVALFFGNSIDCIYPHERRLAALREIRRVLRVGGTAVISSRNAYCLLPYPRHIKEILVNTLSGQIFRPPYRRIETPHGELMMHYADPVAEAAALKRCFGEVTICSRVPAARALFSLPLRLLDPFPYYVCTVTP